MAKVPPVVPVPSLGLDATCARPLYTQLYDRLRRAVLEGTLQIGARLPSTRALAAQLGVSRTTVLAAYEQLLAEGYIESRVGSGTRVVAVLPDDMLRASSIRSSARSSSTRQRITGRRSVARRGERMAQGKFGPELRLAGRSWSAPFRIAVPALDAVPLDVWSRLVARHARRVSHETIDYQDSRGLQRLRVAVAAHLSVSRGLHCTADQVLITAGAQSAIDLAVRILLDPGDTALVENPSHLGIHGALKGAGVSMVPVPVDVEGLVVSRNGAFAAGARLAFVTPSNQFPLAVTMSLSRRLALLDWAARSGAWILEDDYDSEFRYSSRPTEALQALDRAGRVLYIGSYSKVLFPGLRLGYLVVPPDLVDVFTAARRFVDVHPPVLLQAALADFIGEGHFHRHLRRMRLLYAERAATLEQAAGRHLAGLLELRAPQAGMHIVGWLGPGWNDRTASLAAESVGVEARPLSLYSLDAVNPGLVLGFGCVSPKAIEEGVRRLARALAAVTDRASLPR